MRIAIFGSYNRQSVGDKAILIGLLHLLRRAAPEARLRVLALDAAAIREELVHYPWASGVDVVDARSARGRPTRAGPRPGASASELPRPSRAARIALSLPHPIPALVDAIAFTLRLPRQLTDDVDLLLVGGGNLLMDVFPSWPVKLHRVVRRFTAVGVPVHFLGVGALPPRTGLGRVLLRRTLRSARGVSVRDPDSAAVVAGLLGRRPSVYPDFALSMPAPARPRERDQREIVVNAAPLGGPGWHRRDPALFRAYTAGLASALEDVQAKAAGMTFRFVDTNYPADRAAPLEVMRRLREAGMPAERLRYDDRLHSCEETLEILGGARLAVTTRLHAGLLALRAGTPVIALAYQPKVRNILGGLRGVHAIIPISSEGVAPEALGREMRAALDGPAPTEDWTEGASATNLTLLRSILGDRAETPGE